MVVYSVHIKLDSFSVFYKKETDDSPEDKVTKAMKKFRAMSAVEQDEELKKWLRMLSDISTDEYKRIMSEFKSRSKEEKQKRKERHNPVTDTQEFHRLQLFCTIMDNMDLIMDLYHDKREKDKHMVKEAFDVNVKRLIDGDIVNFNADVHSDKLAEILLDLRSLENEMKLSVAGSPLESKSYNDILQSLEDSVEKDIAGSESDTVSSGLLDNLPEASSEYATKLLHSVSMLPYSFVLLLRVKLVCWNIVWVLVRLANRGRLLLRTPGPVPFGTCI